jgi:serine protease Do
MLGAFSLTHMGGEDPMVADVRGVLDSKDAMSTRATYADHYAFTGAAGEPIDVYLRSNDFDAYLIVYDAAGYLIAENDYGGYDYLDAHIAITLPSDALYVVVATSYALEMGDYQLSVMRRQYGSTVPLFDVPGSTARRFTANDSVDPSGNPYHVYAIDLTGGRVITIEMVSDDIDSKVHLYDTQGWEVAMDDDSGGDYNSMLVYVPPATGRYFLVATTYSPPSLYMNPSYDLSVSE